MTQEICYIVCLSNITILVGKSINTLCFIADCCSPFPMPANTSSRIKYSFPLLSQTKLLDLFIGTVDRRIQDDFLREDERSVKPSQIGKMPLLTFVCIDPWTCVVFTETGVYIDTIFNTHSCVYIYTSIYIYTSVYIYIYTMIYIYIYVYTYKCIYIYIR